MDKFINILTVIFCTLCICFIIVFSAIIIQLYCFNKCRNSEYTYDYCEYYKNF